MVYKKRKSVSFNIYSIHFLNHTTFSQRHLAPELTFDLSLTFTLYIPHKDQISARLSLMAPGPDFINFHYNKKIYPVPI